MLRVFAIIFFFFSLCHCYDVIVVGGGLSGLTATYRLAQAGKSVCLFEALSEIGGRTRSHIIAGNLVSVGGTWSLFENRQTLELANEVGAQPFVPVLIPKQLAIQRIAVYPYLILQLWYIGFQMTQSGSNDDFWTTPGAAALDVISLEDWMNQQINASIVAQFGATWASNTKQALRDWFWLWENINDTNSAYIPNLSALSASQFLYQRIRGLSKEGLYTLGAFRWDGGTGVFVNAIVNAIKGYGGQVYTNSPVLSIQRSSNIVTITLQNGTSYNSSYAVVATSLTAAANITYIPDLPSNYQNLFRAIIPNDAGATNCFLTWSYKWYIPAGNTILPDPLGQPSTGQYGEVFELTPQSSSQGVLRILNVNPTASYDNIVGSLTGSAATAAIQSASFAWLNSVYSVLGVPLYSLAISSSILNTTVWDWRSQKPYIPGIVFYWPPNGSLVSWGSALRTPVDNQLYWAGSERAAHSPNWMDGAVQRGNQAACEILSYDGTIQNCSDYSSWIDFLFNSTSSFYSSQPNYVSFLQSIDNIACAAITQSGWACSPNAPYRITGLNAFEIPIYGQIQAALQLIAQLDSTVLQVGQSVNNVFRWLL